MVRKFFKLRPDAKPPVRASDGAVGYDVRALRVLDRETRDPISELPVIIPPGEAVLFGSGIALALPWGYQCEVRPRSGLATKHNIELSNSPGTIDPDFRGEAGILLRNRGNEPFTVNKGDRIAQLIFTSAEIPVLDEVSSIEELPVTRRGTGGFGSTGIAGIGLGTEQHQQEVMALDEYFMGLAITVSELSNCIRGCPLDENGKPYRDDKGKLTGQERKFGCVFARGNQGVSTGYNAQHRGSQLCAEVGCMRDEKGIKSGTQLEICRAVHAEEMAIANAASSGISLEGTTMYVNAIPCIHCAKMITEINVEAAVVLEGAYEDQRGIEILRKAGIPIRWLRPEKEESEAK